MQRSLEGMSALCLTDLMEGKRGRVLWRGLWRGWVRFAYSEGGLEEVGFCQEMQLLRTKFPSGIWLPGPSEAENIK